MGVDINKLPPREEWFQMLKQDIDNTLENRKYFYVGWEFSGKLVGHSNINHITFGYEANIHLHLWCQELRKQGLGIWFFQQSVNFFLHKFQLKKIICEPYAENPAPNKLLHRLGLQPIEKRQITPGFINFKQFVNRYEMTTRFET